MRDKRGSSRGNTLHRLPYDLPTSCDRVEQRDTDDEDYILSELSGKLGIDESELADLLSHPKCPPRDKFLCEANYIKRLQKLISKTTRDKSRVARNVDTRAHARVSSRPRSHRTGRTKQANSDKVSRHRAAKRELPRIPAVADPARRAGCARSFRLHCETYHADIFYAEWGRDHLIVIDRIERSILHGGRFCLAVFRGFGKTRLCAAALVWATVNGHCKFAVLIGAEKEAAVEVLGLVGHELTHNQLLYEDYPEICTGFREIDGNPHKGRYLTFKGKSIGIEMKTGRIRLPIMGHKKTDGTLIRAFGITGRIRGLSDEIVGRPDLAVVDDPQTDESARSPSQVATRRKSIQRSILGLAGHDQKISAIMPCTVVEIDDVTEQTLDDNAWQSFRGKLVYEFPGRQDLWDEYAKIRRRVLPADELAQEATDFYMANREDMDAGAELSWESMYDVELEKSALQHAMNLMIDDEDGFFAEYQNEPRSAAAQLSKIPLPSYIRTVSTSIGKSVVPPWASIVTSSVDVHDEILWWMVCAFDAGFRASIINYGPFPEQGRLVFNCKTPPTPLSKLYPGGPDAVILAGITELVGMLLSYNFRKLNGQEVPINALLVDGGYKPEQSHAARRKYKGAVHVSHGRGIGADRKPISEYARKPGDRFGMDWYIPGSTPKGEPHVLYDANSWKARVLNSWNTPIGDPGSFAIFGDEKDDHTMLCRHLFQSETYVEVDGNSRKILEFRNTSNRDNHLLDCLNMCFVGASMSGAVVPGEDKQRKERKRRYKSLREMQKRAQGK